MELLIAMALAYALSGGVAAGRATAAQHKTPKDPKPADRTDAGRKVAQGAINSVARIYTWTSGAREGWRKAWPETKTTISERRATVKAAKAERRAQREQAPAGAAGEPEVVDAEIVEDEPVNTGGPTAPTAETIADAKEAEAAARAAATVHVHVTTDPPPPDTGPAAAPVPPPRTAPVADAAGAPPSPAEEPVGGPHLRVVKDDGTSPPPPPGAGRRAPPGAA
ncbi:hypothetical protein [Kitasatospora sp. DSM 101779]|uniref:hypothetical protein n=1 Tax=Kitasatospora sp. DSM 101779 TaxID=2853165 RepID=UPI0021DA1108|nr:hypothetical protein [Kitasatospora sp. DSM 101779]MCU7827406.1 hypothetical protein [Kitasatospora sp. DSM 101779]